MLTTFLAGLRFQVIRYAVGQKYNAHFDAYDKTSTRGQRTTADGGNRMLTMLLYLQVRPSFFLPLFSRIFIDFSRFPRDFWPCSPDSWRPDGENGRKMGGNG